MDVNSKTTESVGLMLDVLNENDKNKNNLKQKGFDLNTRNRKDMDVNKNVESHTQSKILENEISHIWI